VTVAPGESPITKNMYFCPGTICPERGFLHFWWRYFLGSPNGGGQNGTFECLRRIFVALCHKRDPLMRADGATHERILFVTQTVVASGGIAYNGPC